MKTRRHILALSVGAAAAWPLAARAQQPAAPVVGFLHNRSPDGMTDRLRAFRERLKDGGYVERDTELPSSATKLDFSHPAIRSAH